MTGSKTPKKKYRIADILKLYWSDYIGSPDRKLSLKDKHFKAVRGILSCRTAALGVNVFACECCGTSRYVYKSCKHRFCPTCGVVETHQWARRVLMELIRMKHHHVVFTLPKALRWLSKRNGDKLHDLLFKVSAWVLKDWFSYKHRLRCGIVSVLHTSGADLKYHPHVHMIVTGGGLDEAGNLNALEKAYLTRQRYFADRFRDRYISALLKLYQKDNLSVAKSLKTELKFKRWLNSVKSTQWIVSIQEPLDEVEHIVRYVGRYTRRACMSEYKLESIEGGKIKFRFNDYANTPRGGKPVIGYKVMSSTAFLDALLEHVPNKGYRMLRYYGIYGSNGQQQIPEELRGIEIKEEPLPKALESLNEYDVYYNYRKQAIIRTGKDPLYCYDCNRPLTIVGEERDESIPNLYEYEDSS